VVGVEDDGGGKILERFEVERFPVGGGGFGQNDCGRVKTDTGVVFFGQIFPNQQTDGGDDE